MHGDAEFACCPVVGALPAVPDIVERSAELDGDALGFDADVEITRSVPTGEHESPVGDVVEQRDADVIADRLLSFVEVDLLRLIAEDLTSLWGEGVCFLRVQRRLAVSGPDTHQMRCLRAARKRSTRSERVTPTGTDLFSNAADARVERRAAR